jgi:hypothetical protein
MDSYKNVLTNLNTVLRNLFALVKFENLIN